MKKKNVFPCKISTGGRGYWSNVVAPVTVTGWDTDGYELRVYFDTKTWSTKRDGLIYTDAAFLKALKPKLKADGFKHEFEYSEQGMQGDDYVSFDIVRKKKKASR